MSVQFRASTRRVPLICLLDTDGQAFVQAIGGSTVGVGEGVRSGIVSLVIELVILVLGVCVYTLVFLGAPETEVGSECLAVCHGWMRRGEGGGVGGLTKGF